MQYRFTFRMILHVLVRGFKWKSYEMSQGQCFKAGFLSGDYDKYYCYNNVVQRCGNVIRFTNNCIGNSSVSTKYAFL
jgi:hypothetical protein